MITVSDARLAIAKAAQPLAAESISVNCAQGRVLAQPVTSAIDLPPFANSAMDGYALRLAELTTLAELPVVGSSFAGSNPAPLAPATAMRIFTGAPLPAGADTVVIQEDVLVDGDRLRLKSAESYRVGENIRAQGHELAQGSVWFERGHVLTAADCGLLAAMGMADVAVLRRPRVALLATGDELTAPGEPLLPGKIYNSNHTLLVNLIHALGCELTYSQTVADDLAATSAALSQASACADIVLCTGGVSVGEADFVKTALESLGELAFWKIAVKPGKPLAFGRIGDAAFFGLPGNPVSAYVTFMLFVWPYLQVQAGVAVAQAAAFNTERAIVDFDWLKAGKREEFLRVTSRRVDGQLRLELLPNQSSGSLSSVALAAGFARVPVGATWQTGSSVEFIAKPF